MIARWLCRIFGHNYRPTAALRPRAYGGHVTVRFKCLRCHERGEATIRTFSRLRDL